MGIGANCGPSATRHAHVFWRCTIDSLNVSNLPRDAADAAQPAGRDGIVPRRWTLHGLNNGPVFHATYHGVRTLPRAVSYRIGTIGTWLAWRLMRTCRAAIADNLRAIFPHETERQLQRRALATLRAG